ncbi:Tr-type G domain-containing protein [Caenorhabditis elegans]|uniref:Tr-type G domain-containing protein n=1 Tax=Caenorhabditis elegans TaxID=6239 RepID=O62109_CAEEL|nr:Tr-type G domain-containing protein [Caenorhabditis elegans]CAB16863.1 Tr-type G domain-containing protein [Caenorhabditis elegans]|eukprot:NP_493276.1 eukaryotic Elongation Factor, SelenoCysteine-tRNA-specific [Caenorhabditis elegans]
MTSPPSTSSSVGPLNLGILGHVDSGKTTLTRRIAELGSTSAFDAHATSTTTDGIRRNTLDLGFSTMTSLSGRRLALIDCPGHSGLIRAVLAASTVFDMAIVISESAKKVRKGLKSMGVDENSPIVEMSLADGYFKEEMLQNLKLAIESRIFEPKRDEEGEFLIAIDHCFAIKGQGTVLTGTVIRGVLRLNTEIEFPALNEKRRVKTLETWKQRVGQVAAGARAAFLVAPSFDEHRFSRCICGPLGTLKSTKFVLATVEPIQFFRKSINSKSKIHVAVAFETVMAECQFLKEKENGEFEMLPSLLAPCQVLFSFEKSIFLPENYSNPFMAARLEQQPGSGCRFAFSGIFSQILPENGKNLPPRFTRKCRKGHVERVEKDGFSAICTGMFKAETNFDVFRGFQICTSSGPRGKIEGAFGKSGKFRVTFAEKIDGILTEKEEISLFLKKYHNENRLVSYVPD